MASTSTYFDSMKRSYSEVIITSEGIDTVTFLEASEELVKIFGTLKSHHLLTIINH